jgi:glycosyltransferase involved in cell wall biosynthesis
MASTKKPEGGGMTETLAKSPEAVRLGFVSHRFQRNDGQGRVNYEVVKAALDRGYHVTVLAIRCADDIANHPNARFIPMCRDGLPTAIVRNLVFARASARWLRKHRGELDIVQANGFVTWVKCDIVAAHFIHTTWKKSQYFPYTSFSPYHLYQRNFTRLNSRWERQAFLGAKRVIAVSKHIGHALEALGVAASSIDVIYNGVDTDQFQPGVSTRANFGLPEGVQIGLFVGDIKTKRKNLETVLEAMTQVPSLYLAVAGSAVGSPYPAIARELGISDRVIFLGKVSAIADLMRSVDMFLFPSRYEAHPLVVLEAMASGLPMVVSGVFGAEDFIGGGGLILEDPNDVQGMVRLLNQLVSNESARAAMGQAGRRMALQMQWSMMAEKYLDVYRKMS